VGRDLLGRLAQKSEAVSEIAVIAVIARDRRNRRADYRRPARISADQG
jgi:hypothetical protein